MNNPFEGFGQAGEILIFPAEVSEKLKVSENATRELSCRVQIKSLVQSVESSEVIWHSLPVTVYFEKSTTATVVFLQEPQ